MQPLTIDLRQLPTSQRQAAVFEALLKLAVNGSLIVQDTNDINPLRQQVKSQFGQQFDESVEEATGLNQLRFTRRALPSAILVDIVAKHNGASHAGPQWAHECDDLDVTLLSWELGHFIEPHVNHEVDGVFVGVAGMGVVTVNGTAHELRAGVVLIIPRGSERSILAGEERFSYLSVHRRRRGLMPTINFSRGPSVKSGK
jgi:mannose-6-phosphate isomerase-like protein (cupin superfamily)